MQRRRGFDRPIAPLLRAVMRQAGTAAIIDLGSGGGGPIAGLAATLLKDGSADSITLTDLYPNLATLERLAARFPGQLRVQPDPVDATDVPSSLRGVRTLINAFHHLPPSIARRVLASAVEAGEAICVFEISDRSFAMTALVLLTPLYAMFSTAVLRPLRPGRFFWTFVIPLIPLVCTWDGIVSQLRAYTVPELLALTHGLDGQVWTARRVRLGRTPAHLTYLLGIPRQASPPSSGVSAGLSTCDW